MECIIRSLEQKMKNKEELEMREVDKLLEDKIRKVSDILKAGEWLVTLKEMKQTETL